MLHIRNVASYILRTVFINIKLPVCRSVLYSAVGLCRGRRNCAYVLKGRSSQTVRCKLLSPSVKIVTGPAGHWQARILPSSSELRASVDRSVQSPDNGFFLFSFLSHQPLGGLPRNR